MKKKTYIKPYTENIQAELSGHFMAAVSGGGSITSIGDESSNSDNTKQTDKNTTIDDGDDFTLHSKNTNAWSTWDE